MQQSELFKKILGAVGSDKDELESQIWREFGCTRAVRAPLG